MNAAPHLGNNNPLPERIRAQLPVLLEATSIARDGLAATVGDEYLPAAADPNIWRIRSRQTGPVVRSVPAIPVEVIKDSGTEILLAANSSSPARLSIARWFFPDWECKVGSIPCKVEKNEAGAVEISIPSGDNRIELRLKPPRARRVTLWASLFCLVVWGCVWGWPSKPDPAPGEVKKKAHSPKHIKAGKRTTVKRTKRKARR